MRIVSLLPSILLLLGACSPPHVSSGDEGDRIDSTVHSLALSSVANQRGEEISRLDTKGLRIQHDSSKAVPNLVWFRVYYDPPGSTHAGTAITIAGRAGSPMLVETPSDLTELVQDWAPTDRSEAVALCAEVVQYLGKARHYPVVTLPYVGLEIWPRLYHDSVAPPWSKDISLPDARRTSNAWVIDLWAFEPGRLARYECRLVDGGTLDLMILDSLPGHGIPPYGP